MDTIEKHVRKVYDEIKEVIPSLHHFDLSVTTYDAGNTEIWGFVHSANGCRQYRSITEVKDMLLHNAILFRKFDFLGEVKDGNK